VNFNVLWQNASRFQCEAVALLQHGVYLLSALCKFPNLIFCIIGYLINK